jgi:hypothetical protein
MNLALVFMPQRMDMSEKVHMMKMEMHQHIHKHLDGLEKSWIQEHTSDTFIYEIRPHVISDYKQGETYVYTNYEKAELACLRKLIEIAKNK